MSPFFISCETIFDSVVYINFPTSVQQWLEDVCSMLQCCDLRDSSFLGKKNSMQFDPFSAFEGLTK